MAGIIASTEHSYGGTGDDVRRCLDLQGLLEAEQAVFGGAGVAAIAGLLMMYTRRERAA
jgi:hypothetical protein